MALIITQRWARAYMDSSYHATVETNNGAEAMNRSLKYKYLPRQKHMTLSHIITSITEEFLPALHHKYVYQNIKQSDLYRTYNPSVVPHFLQGRPKATILHCLHRQAKSNSFKEADVSDSNEEGKFEVQGKATTHTVNFGTTSGEPACTCKDWVKHRIPCKHFFGVFRFRPQWCWERLPQSYLQSPYLILDQNAIQQYVQESSQPDLLQDSCEPEGQSACLPSEAPKTAGELDQPEQNKTTAEQIARKVWT